MRLIGHFAALTLATAAIATPACSQEFGTFAEAKALLERAVVEVRADRVRAFETFNSNHPRFRDRDLFVFCFGAEDGKFTAHEAMVAHDVRDMNDLAGRSFGAKMFAEAREGAISEIAYLWSFPGSTSRVPKRAFVTRVGADVCGVSAYLYNGPGSLIE